MELSLSLQRGALTTGYILPAVVIWSAAVAAITSSIYGFIRMKASDTAEYLAFRRELRHQTTELVLAAARPCRTSGSGPRQQIQYCTRGQASVALIAANSLPLVDFNAYMQSMQFCSNTVEGVTAPFPLSPHSARSSFTCLEQALTDEPVAFRGNLLASATLEVRPSQQFIASSGWLAVQGALLVPDGITVFAGGDLFINNLASYSPPGTVTLISASGTIRVAAADPAISIIAAAPAEIVTPFGYTAAKRSDVLSLHSLLLGFKSEVGARRPRGLTE